MLAAALKPLARCPCPRCLITKAQIPESGSKRDSKRRGRTRADSEAVQTAISNARALAFKGKSLAGKAVLSHTQSESIYPVRVSIAFFCLVLTRTEAFTERLLRPVLGVRPELL